VLFSVFLMVVAFLWLLVETRFLTVRLPTGPLGDDEREFYASCFRTAPGCRVGRSRLSKGVLGVCCLLLPACLLPAALQYLVIQSPGRSAAFDCDDSTLWTIERLELLGIDAKPLLGNLKKEGAEYWESDHIWVVVDVFGRWVALDWGGLRFDRPHYRGYVVSRQELLMFVEQDRIAAEETAQSAAALTGVVAPAGASQ
jgi:hypothetical protein